MIDFRINPLTRSAMYDTPDSVEDFDVYLEGFNGTEKVAAVVCSSMAWNLASKLIDDQGSSVSRAYNEGRQPAAILRALKNCHAQFIELEKSGIMVDQLPLDICLLAGRIEGVMDDFENKHRSR